MKRRTIAACAATAVTCLALTAAATANPDRTAAPKALTKITFMADYPRPPWVAQIPWVVAMDKGWYKAVEGPARAGRQEPARDTTADKDEPFRRAAARRRSPTERGEVTFGDGVLAHLDAQIGSAQPSAGGRARPGRGDPRARRRGVLAPARRGPGRDGPPRGLEEDRDALLPRRRPPRRPRPDVTLQLTTLVAPPAPPQPRASAPPSCAACSPRSPASTPSTARSCARSSRSSTT